MQTYAAHKEALVFWHKDNDPRHWNRVYLASEVDAEIAKLKEALKKYGGHLELCEKVVGGLCTCGLSTFL